MRFPSRLGRLLPVLYCLLLAASAFAAEVTETVLPNGLRVLISEVHAAPVVTVDMWYKVGSRNEHQGVTGGSHLLEHMTYKGTREFGKEEMKTLLKRNGALDNGATFYDYTHYYTTIASDRLALPLRVEASRLRSALIRQQDLDSEMTVVRSELEGRENSPGSVLFSSIMATAFATHAYRWPVIGWRADVEHMKATQLQQYYRTYYQPNNATLVIVGDVDTQRALHQVRAQFAALPRGPAPSQWTTPEPPQRGERRVTVRRQGQVPIENIAWHVPAITHADIPALMLLEQVLGSGRSSRLYQQIVEKKLGVSAWANSLLMRDSGVFFIGGAASPGQSLEPIETALLAEVERVKITPPTAEEMARALRQIEASLVYGRDSVTQQASQLGYYATVAGDWRFLDALPARLRAVTPEDIARVARTYLTEDNRTIGVFSPTARGPQTASAPATSPAGYRGSTQDATPVAARPNPRTAPTPAPTAPVAHPRRERFVLPNGLVLIVQENHANPTVAISASMKAGKAYDPPGKAGLADMTANLLDHGTTTRSSNEIARELEGAAADISAGTGWETVGLHGHALSGDIELLLRNLADLTRNANFPAEEVEKMREQMLAGLAMERDEPNANAQRNLYRAILPAGHPYRMASFEEEAAGTRAISRDDLLAFYHARYTPRSLVMAVVGDVQVARVRALVDTYFGDWQGATPAALDFTTPPAEKGTRVVTRIADKSEVDIYVGSPGGLRRTDPDYFPAMIMNMILGGGGALNSRLGDVIRDQHGLAYSVYSAFHASTGAGPWYAFLGVNPDNVDQAITLLTAEVVRMRDQGVTAQEVQDAVSFLSGAHAIALETNAAMAGELMDAEYFHLGLDYPERVSRLYRAVTRDQVNAAARKYLHPDALSVSIAGPYGP